MASAHSVRAKVDNNQQRVWEQYTSQLINVLLVINRALIHFFSLFFKIEK